MEKGLLISLYSTIMKKKKKEGKRKKKVKALLNPLRALTVRTPTGAQLTAL